MHVRTVNELGAFIFNTDMKLRVMRLPMVYKMKMRKLFNLYNNWLLQWRFPDDRRLIKSDLLTLF